jgi:class 3 adenylate cyclase/tetratricopeptide (TPR) repeat protein
MTPPSYLTKVAVLVLLFLLPFGQNRCTAQSVADSLQIALRTARHDTTRALLLDELGWELKQDNPANARRHLREAIALSQKWNFTRGLSKAWNDLGVLETIHGDLAAAEAAFKLALDYRQQLGDLKGVASVYSNLADIQDKQGDFVGAFSYYQQSLRIAEELRDSARVARLHYNMAFLHERMGNYPEAMDLIYRYLIYAERTDDAEGMAYAYNILGNINYALERAPEALENYARALATFRSLDHQWEAADVLNNIANVKGDLAELAVTEGRYQDAVPLFDSAIAFENEVINLRRQLENEPGLSEAINNLGVVHKDLGSYYQAIGQQARAQETWKVALGHFRQALQMRESLGDKKGIIEVYNGLGDVYRRQRNYKLALEYTKRYLDLALDIGDQNFVQSAYKDLSKIYAETGDYLHAYEYRKKYDEYRYLRLDEKRVKDIERRQALYGDQQKQLEIERQQQRNALLDAQLREQQAEIRRATLQRRSLLGGALGLLLLAGLLYNRNRIKTKANRDLAEKNQIIEQERQRSENLLLNILPAQTAEELKAHGKAQAREYESVTVLFSDFKSFTTIAETMKAEELVAEIDTCFQAFDAITGRHGIEKIKTIGDSYMCVGGLPSPNDTHPTDVVSAALEMQAFMQEHNAGRAAPFEMRIGVHTGPVVAGVVGTRKFAYDIWGDTVNLAARMEQNSQPGRVNISQSTFERVKGVFECAYRGKISAKNKGEVDMYFVETE